MLAHLKSCHLVLLQSWEKALLVLKNHCHGTGNNLWIFLEMVQNPKIKVNMISWQYQLIMCTFHNTQHHSHPCQVCCWQQQPFEQCYVCTQLYTMVVFTFWMIRSLAPQCHNQRGTLQWQPRRWARKQQLVDHHSRWYWPFCKREGKLCHNSVAS